MISDQVGWKDSAKGALSVGKKRNLRHLVLDSTMYFNQRLHRKHFGFCIKSSVFVDLSSLTIGTNKFSKRVYFDREKVETNWCLQTSTLRFWPVFPPFLYSDFQWDSTSIWSKYEFSSHTRYSKYRFFSLSTEKFCSTARACIAVHCELHGVNDITYSTDRCTVLLEIWI